MVIISLLLHAGEAIRFETLVIVEIGTIDEARSADASVPTLVQQKLA
jgi:hypothetical protein